MVKQVTLNLKEYESLLTRIQGNNLNQELNVITEPAVLNNTTHKIADLLNLHILDEQTILLTVRSRFY